LKSVRWKGPLASSYTGALLLVICALTPYLALSTAITPLSSVLSKSVGLSPQGLQLTNGIANAAYAFGTVAAVQLAMHLPGRRMLVLYATLLVVGSVLAASAWTPGLFVAGHVLQGLCTSLLLIAAVPPLVIGWPANKTRWSATTMNMCIFGAVSLGPVIGGVQASAHDWRPLLWIVAGVSVLALLLTLLTFEDQPPADRSAPWDWVAQLLAGAGCASAFFGASELQTHPMLSLIVFLPLLAGVGMLAALVLHQYGVREPLMPMRSLTSTLPLSGILVAMCAGAASIALIELTQTALQTKLSPSHVAALFWPQFGAALLATALLASLLRTRFLAPLALGGLILLAAAAAVLSGVAHGPNALVAVGSGLLGLGAGSAVAPALFVAGFSQRSQDVQRVFALVELLRGVAAFLAAPIILHLAKTTGATPAAGITTGVWVCFGIACLGALTAVYLFVLGRVRLRPPQLERWLDGDEPAFESPALAAGIRGEGMLPAIEPAGLGRGRT
jgi:MFS family permease